MCFRQIKNLQDSTGQVFLAFSGCDLEPFFCKESFDSHTASLQEVTIAHIGFLSNVIRQKKG
jgi:hypothetical protein